MEYLIGWLFKKFMSYIPLYKVQYADSSNLDAFSRVRVSNNHILFSSQQTFNDLPLLWANSSSVNATSSYDSSAAATTLLTSKESGSTFVRQSKEYFLYRAGQSHNVALTFADMSGQDNISKKVGYFDQSDGVYLETTGSETYFCLKSSVTSSFAINKVSQSAWNIDPLDGTGPSGVNLNLSMSQILLFDLQWLGVGRVRAGFDIDGNIIPAHEFLHANINPNIYMRRATLPVRYEIHNNAVSTASGSLDQICSSVVREGGSEDQGILTTLNVFNEDTTATTTPRTILSVRLRDTSIRGALRLVRASILNRGAQPIRAQIILNPTVTGAHTWENSGSIVQKSVAQLDYTNNTGHILGTDFIDSTTGAKTSLSIVLENILKVVADIDGTSDILSIVVDSFSGTQNCDASLTFLELY